MRHTRKETRAKAAAFAKMVKNHPLMPTEFTHRQYKLAVKYAKCAFNTGWNSGEIYYRDTQTEPT